MTSKQPQPRTPKTYKDSEVASKQETKDVVSQKSNTARSSSARSSSSSTGSTYSETPDYVILEIKLKEQSDLIKLQEMRISQLTEQLGDERNESIKLLKKLELQAKQADKKVLELSQELVKSRELCKRFQHLYETEQIQRNQDKHNSSVVDAATKLEMKIQGLETEIGKLKEEKRQQNYDVTQMRKSVKQAQNDRDEALKQYDASERDRTELRQRLSDLDKNKKRHNQQLTTQTQDWLKKSKQLDLLKEDLRWAMLETSVPYKSDLGKKANFNLPKNYYMPKRLQQLNASYPQPYKNNQKGQQTLASSSKSSISSSNATNSTS